MDSGGTGSGGGSDWGGSSRDYGSSGGYGGAGSGGYGGAAGDYGGGAGGGSDDRAPEDVARSGAADQDYGESDWERGPTGRVRDDDQGDEGDEALQDTARPGSLTTGGGYTGGGTRGGVRFGDSVLITGNVVSGAGAARGLIGGVDYGQLAEVPDMSFLYTCPNGDPALDFMYDPGIWLRCPVCGTWMRRAQPPETDAEYAQRRSQP